MYLYNVHVYISTCTMCIIYQGYLKFHASLSEAFLHCLCLLTLSTVLGITESQLLLQACYLTSQSVEIEILGIVTWGI